MNGRVVHGGGQIEMKGNDAGNGGIFLHIRRFLPRTGCKIEMRAFLPE
jgi:hypothetical protein